MTDGTMKLLLAEIFDFLKDREDVCDGSDGRPRPNAAMNMLMEFGDRIKKAGAIVTDESKKKPHAIGTAISEADLLLGYGPKIAAAAVTLLLAAEAVWLGWFL